MDKLGIFHANQTSMCLVHSVIQPCGHLLGKC